MLVYIAQGRLKQLDHWSHDSGMHPKERDMSLKTAFGAVLKAMRISRGLTQKHLSDASSRTYLSKLERAQSSLTVDKLDAISQTLELSPLTLLTITLGTQTGEPLRVLLDRLETELLDLQHSGVLKDLAIDLEPFSKAPRAVARPEPRKKTASSSLQTELHFIE